MTPFRRRRVLELELLEGSQLVGLLSDYTRTPECQGCGLRRVADEDCGCIQPRVVLAVAS